MKMIECVPNFSEGRRAEAVDAIARTVETVPGIILLDYSRDEDHNRSVVTFIGPPDSIVTTALTVCEKALSLIDMRSHRGVHPRVGAVDVVPFIPLCGATMEDAVTSAHEFGRDFAARHGIPVFFYGMAALLPNRKNLAAIRKGQYEGITEKLCDPHWQPDTGPSLCDPRFGATCVGARKPLIAYNINLATDDISVARDIAQNIRQSSGGLPSVMAMGVMLKSRNIAQVSMNLTDYEATSVKTVFDTVRALADTRGVAVLESELIGLLPAAALKDVSPAYLKLRDFGPDRIIENNIP